MNSINLITNALLAVTWEHSKKDYIDIISPFIIYAAYHESDKASEYVDINKVKSFIQKEFSLEIIDSIIKCALKRNTKFFYSKTIDGCKNYFIVSQSDYDPNVFENRRLKNQQDFDYFIDKMDEFFNRCFNKKYERSVLENKLSCFIDQNFMGLLNADNKVTNYRDKELAEFMKQISENDRNLLSILQNIVKGRMIYVSIYAQDVVESNYKQKMKNLCVYFDTTFVFNLLGYGGKYNQEYSIQIIELLKGLGAHLYCFEHNYEEVLGILQRCEKALSMGKADELWNLDFFLENNYNASDLVLIISKLRTNISKFLAIVDVPDYSIPTTNIDWLAFSDHLQQSIKYKKSSNLEHDVESIAAIFRLRAGHLSRTIEGCRAIFVTTNLKLVSAVRDYHKTGNDKKGYWPCISDYEIANISWLKTPNKQKEIVDRSIRFATELLLEPSPVFWKRFVQIVDKYKEEGAISADDALELKYELYSRKNAEDYFDGDETKVSFMSLQEWLKKIREQHNSEMAHELQEKKDRLARFEEEDIKKAVKKAKKVAIIGTIMLVLGYIISLTVALAVLGVCIWRIAIGEYYHVAIIIVEILGIILFTLIPKIKNIWKIKTNIGNCYAKNYAKSIEKSNKLIESKYRG